MEVGQEYRLARLGELAGVDEEDVRAFWEHEVALPTALADERVGQLGLLAVEAGDERALAAVSTVYARWSAQLRCELWQVRALVGRRHRSSGLAARLLRETRARLEAGFVSGSERRAPGILLEIENPILRAARNEATWEPTAAPLDRAGGRTWPAGTRYAFIGENAHGHHVRVYWFEGALAPPPEAAAEGGPAERQ